MILQAHVVGNSLHRDRPDDALTIPGRSAIDERRRIAQSSATIPISRSMGNDFGASVAELAKRCNRRMSAIRKAVDKARQNIFNTGKDFIRHPATLRRALAGTAPQRGTSLR